MNTGHLLYRKTEIHDRLRANDGPSRVWKVVFLQARYTEYALLRRSTIERKEAD